MTFTSKDADFAFRLNACHSGFFHNHFCLEPKAKKFKQFIVNNPGFLTPLLPLGLLHEIKEAS
jgi:hypothetical protein